MTVVRGIAAKRVKTIHSVFSAMKITPRVEAAVYCNLFTSAQFDATRGSGHSFECQSPLPEQQNGFNRIMTRLVQRPPQRFVALQIETRIGEQNFNKSWKITHASDFSKLSEKFLLGLQPDVVICPLFTTRFDVIDVARLMLRTCNQCRILIDAPPLPRPSMVLREIAEACPGTNVAFVTALSGQEAELLSASF